MSDDPNKLKAILLENASTDDQKQFAQMLAEQCAIADSQKDNRHWLFIPSATEYEKMKKFTEKPNYDKCPKCSKGRVILKIFHGNFGDSLELVCMWGNKDCDFKEYISDDL